MIKFFTNLYPVVSLYKTMSIKSEIITQMICGDSFSIITKSKKWLKIQIKEDGYKGYIKNKNFKPYVKPTHKICTLRASVYKFPNNKKKISQLSFASKIKIKDKKFKFIKFDNGWIRQKDTKPVNFTENNVFKKINIFQSIKYKWGGKTFKGIDCSALIQVCFNFNNRFCPRDAKDQIKYFKKNITLKQIKKNDIIYWKGHVALVLSKKNLIHAYGPMKKTIIMGVDETIKKIQRTANLKVVAIKRVLS